jgi:hypothetical protein
VGLADSAAIGLLEDCPEQCVIESEADLLDGVGRENAGRRDVGFGRAASPPTRRFRLRRNRATFVGVCFALFAVLILILSSYGSTSNPESQGNGHLQTSQLGIAANSTAFPYLVNTSLFPAPVRLLNGSGNATLPQLAASEAGTSAYDLLWAQQWLNRTNDLEYTQGHDNTSLAQSIYNNTTQGGCTRACPPSLPLSWGTLGIVAAFGTHAIQADALAARDVVVAAAATVGNKTYAYLGYDYGDFFPWRNLTAGGPITGNSPKLAISPCTTWDGIYSRAVLMTTLWSGKASATTFPVTCAPNVNVTSASSGHPNVSGPNVTSLYPTAGGSGTVVTINGTGFTQDPPVVTFNGVDSPTVTWKSVSQVTAVAPNLIVPTVAPVQVVNYGLASPIKSWTFFDYERPAVTGVAPSYGPPGTQISITGLNFTGGSLVFFGNTSASSTQYLSSTALLATSPIPLPSQAGTVNVTVVTSGGVSADWSHDLYTYTLPAAISKTLTGAVGAAPFWVPGPYFGYEGVVVANATSGQVVDYNSSNLGESYTSTVVGTFSPGLGSNVFTQVGSTRLDLPGGPTGQVTAAAENSSVLVGVTTESQGMIVLETTSTQNGGGNWSAPYLTEPPAGSLSDPQLVASPAGYYYATWRDDGAGDWEVDQTVFSEEGRVILSPQVLLKSGGASGYSAQPPTVAVDGLQRALFAWGTPNATGNEIRLEGAFPSAATAVSILSGAFDNTSNADYLASFGSANTWKGWVERDIGWLRTNVTLANSGCRAAQNLIRLVYPNVTYNPTPELASQGYCSPTTTNSEHFMGNTSGPLVASTYLEVYADWVGEAIGWGAVFDPAWAGSPTGTALTLDPVGLTHTSLAFDSSDESSYTANGDLLNVTPTTESPTSILFRTALYDPGGNGQIYSSPGGMIGGSVAHTAGVCSWTEFNETRYEYVRSVLTLTNHSGSGQPIQITVTSHTGTPWIYVTNLSGNEWGTWTLVVNATGQHYWGTNYRGDCLGAQNASSTSLKIPSGFPGNFTIYTGGTFLTSLEIANSTNETRAPTLVVEGTEQSGAQRNYVQFNTSIRTGQYSALNYTQNSQNHVQFSEKSAVNQYLTEYNVSLGMVPVTNAYTYLFTTRVSTLNGSPALAMNKSTTVINTHSFVPSNYTGGPLSSFWTCSYAETANPIVVGGSAANGILNVTATTAKLIWISNYSGQGWATYHELGGSNFTVQAGWYENSSGLRGNLPDRYEVELHGLHPWGIYTVQVGVASTSGCLTFENWLTWHFQTLTQVALEEKDQAYDSITGQGGGAVVEWQAPLAFIDTTTFDSGLFEYWPTGHPTSATTIPLTALPPWIPNGPLFTSKNVSYTFGENLTALNVSTEYNVSLIMNFTVEVPWGTYNFTAGSLPFEFWYLKDTSGDALTDQEKERGWEATYEAANGTWVDQWVTANPQNYSSNGVIGDYFEKEYGLNPRTVDTAGSHMLDGWNLTFNLGANSSSSTKVPSTTHLRVWNEEGTYNWTESCQIFELAGCQSKYSFNPIALDASNLTDNFGSRAKYPASYNWSADVLYQGFNGSGGQNQLLNLLNSTGVQNTTWLRGILGNVTIQGVSYRTLTIWGKLSWGANPLATSTPHDGIPDGSRVNPSHDVALDINISKVTYSGCPGAGSGSYSWALRFDLNYSTTSSGDVQLSNWSSQTNYSHTSCGSLANYLLPMPINATSPNESLTIQLYVNEGTRISPSWGQARVNGTTLSSLLTINYNALRARVLPIKGLGSSSGGGAGYGHVFGNLSVIPIGTKDASYLWQPTAGGTLSSAPWGLKRYAGDQSFDLVVINAKHAVTSGAIPSPLNSSILSYLALPAGLVSILVPAQQFLESPFGDTVSYLSNQTDNSSTSPLIGTSNESSLLSGYSGSDPLDSDICYWLNRVVNVTTNSSPIEHCSMTGTRPKTNASVFASDISTTTSSNVGGLPSDPVFGTMSGGAPALQSVITLNISSAAELDLLLAGLLDNRTGGVNGTLVQITAEVPNLGFEPAVSNAVANVSLISSGLYPYPAASGWRAPGCSSICVSNLATAVAIVNGVLYGLVLSTGLGIAYYIYQHQPLWLRNIEATEASRAVAGIRSAAAALVSELSQLLAWIETQVKVLLGSAWAPIQQGLNSWGSNVWGAYNNSYSYYGVHSSLTNPLIGTFWSAVAGNPLTGAIAMGVVAAVVFTLLAPVDVGESEVVDWLFAVASIAILGSLVAPAGAGFGSGGLTAVQNFLEAQSGINSAFKDPVFYGTFQALIVVTSAIAALLSWGLWEEVANPADFGSIAMTVALFVVSVLALAIDAIGFVYDSPPLLFFALVFSAGGALLAARLASQEDNPATLDIVVSSLFMGGFSGIFDLVKIMAYA